MLVSFCVPTRARTDKLHQCLEFVSSQTYKNWECIIIDDNDSDIWSHYGLQVWMEKWKDRTKIVHASNILEGFPVHNLGVQNSNGEIIFRLDDDVILDSNFVKLGIEGFSDPNVVAVGGYFITNKKPFEKLLRNRGNLLKFSPTSFGYSMSYTLDIQLRPHSLERILGVEHIQSSYMYRKSAIQEIGGFNETIRNGEETIPFIHWSLRGYKSVIHTGCKALHLNDDRGWKASKRFFPQDSENLQKLLKQIFDQYGCKIKNQQTLSAINEQIRTL